MRPNLTAAVLALLAGLLTGCGTSEGSPVPVQGYSLTEDPRVIVVHFTTGTCDKVSAPVVSETAQSVTISVLVRVAGPDEKCSTLAPANHAERVTLKSDLGSRTVRGREQDPDVQLVPATPPGA